MRPASASMAFAARAPARALCAACNVPGSIGTCSAAPSDAACGELTRAGVDTECRKLDVSQLAQLRSVRCLSGERRVRCCHRAAEHDVHAATLRGAVRRGAVGDEPVRARVINAIASIADGSKSRRSRTVRDDASRESSIAARFTLHDIGNHAAVVLASLVAGPGSCYRRPRAFRAPTRRGQPITFVHRSRYRVIL